MKRNQKEDLLLFIERAKERNFKQQYLLFLDKQKFSINAVYNKRKQLTNNKKRD